MKWCIVAQNGKQQPVPRTELQRNCSVSVDNASQRQHLGDNRRCVSSVSFFHREHSQSADLC